MRWMMAACGLILLGACEAIPTPEQDISGPGSVFRGRAIVERHCAGCHAIDRTGASPYEGAPPFRALAAQGGVADLAESFAEGSGIPHKGEVVMPEFVMTPQAIEDLIAYVDSLK